MQFTLTEALLLRIAEFAITFGIPATVEFFKNLSTTSTIDDAIAALDKASQKTAQQYLDEAKARISPPTA